MSAVAKPWSNHQRPIVPTSPAAQTNGGANGDVGRYLPPALAPLTMIPHWVCWRFKKKDDGTYTKPPFQVNGAYAENDNPETWATYEAVTQIADKYDGIGFVISNTEISAFDLDDCRDAATGVVESWAQAVVDKATSYTEVTPSGEGLRIIGYGVGAEVHRKLPVPNANGMSCELYRKATRFITITGNIYRDAPLANIDAVIDAVLAELDTKPKVDVKVDGSQHTLPPLLLSLLHLPNLGESVRHGGYDSRSALLFAFLTGAARARVADEMIVKTCLDATHTGKAIFEHIKDNGGRTYVERQIERARKKVGDAGNDSDASALVATPYVCRDPTKIPPRDFLYGKHLIRKFLSAKIAQGGVGKSTLTVAETLAMTSGRNLLGVTLPKRRLRVWLWNLEDPKEETERKIQAAALHYKLSPQDIEPFLFIDSGRDQKLVIAETTRDGAKIIRPVVDSLVDQVIARNVDVLIIDPFVSSHRVVENSNDDMDLVVKQWSAIAEFGNCAVELVHHSKKGEQEKTVESSRGAIAITDACRSVQVLNRMTKEEAERAGVQNHRLHFRVYADKANLAPPAEISNWFRLETVELGNGPHFGGVGGDEVGVAVRWVWPDAMAGITDADFGKVASEIRAGKWRENSQAKTWVGLAVARALNLDSAQKGDRARIGAMLKTWLAAGLLVAVEGFDEKSMQKRFVEAPRLLAFSVRTAPTPLGKGGRCGSRSPAPSAPIPHPRCGGAEYSLGGSFPAPFARAARPPTPKIFLAAPAGRLKAGFDGPKSIAN